MNEGGMKAFQEQQEREKLAREFAESCAQSEIELRQLLLDLDTALKDFAFVFDLHKGEHDAAWIRITLAEIAALRERIRRARG